MCLQVFYFSRDEWKARTEEYIRRHIRDKPYADILNVEVFFIDNTRSGSYFWWPDQTTLKLRQLILSDAQQDPSAADPVPLRWLPFTEGLQDEATDGDQRPVVTVEELTLKANQLCGIPSEEVPAMLRFHHDLGLLLHYHRVPLLRHNVITNVPWVVTVTSALLHPLTTGHQDYETQFRLLHDHGILLESLAIHIWSVRCPEEAVHLSSPEQRSFLFCLYESFSMLYDTGKMMVPPGGHTPSHAWLCPPLVRKLGDAATSHDNASQFKESSYLYLICQKGGHFLQTQFWRLVVECLWSFHAKDSSPSQLCVEGTRMPLLFHRSARLPCDAKFPGYHLCIAHLNRGVELVILREEAAIRACRAFGREVPQLQDVGSNLLVFIEEKLEELKGDGIAQPVWRRMGGCRCTLSRAPCREHRKHDCRSPGCLHFVDLQDEIPCCPLGDHPTVQAELVEDIYSVWMEVRSLCFQCHAKSSMVFFRFCKLRETIGTFCEDSKTKNS